MDCATHASMEAYLTVAVASKFRDKPDMIVSDLYHLFTDVILWTDAALSACPSGQKTNVFKLTLISDSTVITQENFGPIVH